VSTLEEERGREGERENKMDKINFSLYGWATSDKGKKI